MFLCKWTIRWFIITSCVSYYCVTRYAAYIIISVCCYVLLLSCCVFFYGCGPESEVRFLFCFFPRHEPLQCRTHMSARSRSSQGWSRFKFMQWNRRPKQNKPLERGWSLSAGQTRMQENGCRNGSAAKILCAPYNFTRGSYTYSLVSHRPPFIRCK